MAKKMTIEDLARLVEERAQGIEDKIVTDMQSIRTEIAGLATREDVKDVLQEVNHVEELLKGKVDTQ